MKRIAFLILVTFFVLSNNLLSAQQTENWLEKTESIQLGKLYLHTDRASYFQGDSIWYKAYYLDGQTNQLLPGLNNMFTDLIDEQGDIVQSQLLPLTYGMSSGNLKISRTLEPGTYILRAYSNAQKQIGEHAYFHKTIKIYKLESTITLENTVEELPLVNASDMDVALFAEGGFLLAGMVNTVAVKAVDANGNGIDVKGRLIDKNRNQIATFRTDYQGMGVFQFLPKSGENFAVEVEGISGYKKELNEIKKEGIKFTYLGIDNDKLNFVVSANSKFFLNKEYYFAILNKGKVLLYNLFVQKNSDTKIIIDQADIAGGINKAMLLDASFKPISERLFFSHNYEINDINISMNQDVYQTRSEVKLDLNDSRPFSNQSFSSLSISVVDETVSKNGQGTNIHSWLLLDSDLKGHVESPSDYFIDDENISSFQKINLLMLTQGWSNYIWDGLNPIDMDWHKGEGGLTIEGKAKKLWSKNPIQNGDVLLGLVKAGNMDVFQTKTDSIGRFAFKNLIFTENVSVFVQVQNDKGRKSTEVALDKLFDEHSSISGFFLKSTKKKSHLPLELLQKKYYSEKEMKGFDPSYGSITLEEITVKSTRIEKEDDVSNRVYRKPIVSLKITEKDETHIKLIDYLRGRVPSVTVMGNHDIIIRGLASIQLSSIPLFLLNGATVSPDVIMVGSRIKLIPPRMIMDLPLNSIDRVEVYKTGGETAMFGMQGSNGVISVYTKQGSEVKKNSMYIKGAISTIVEGYEPYREFYTPKYTAENISSERPDNRLTLYWNPNVMTQNGKSSLSFFTSDDISKFKIFVEGITNDGKICLGEAEFAVNEYNVNLIK